MEGVAVGAIWLRGGELIGTIVDIVGFKLGLAAPIERLATAVEDAGLHGMWPTDFEAVYRYRSEEVEELTLVVLAAMGDADAVGARPPLFSYLLSFRDKPEEMAVMGDLITALERFVEATPDGGTLDPRPFVEYAHATHGDLGAVLAIRLLDAVNAQRFVSPWNRIRRREWTDLVELDDLFRSEGLEPSHGVFLDQRFVDFLSANFDEVDRINWRKFEALAGEWFSRLGLHVELASGRNDDGVDLRIWPTMGESAQPALIIAQCKRQKRKVEKVVLKALHADVQFEGARSGLIVTTSCLSPGAQKVNRLRGYHIQEANRDTLRSWLSIMRTPGTGVFLAE
jgi:restriction system protein